MREQDAAALIEALRHLVRTGRTWTAHRPNDGVPTSLVQVLALLDEGGEVRLGSIAHGMAVDTSVASRHVAAAADLGLLRRRADPHDGRACLVSITAVGATTLARHRAGRVDWLLQATKAWSDEDSALLHDLLVRLRDDAVALGRTPAAAGV